MIWEYRDRNIGNISSVAQYCCYWWKSLKYQTLIVNMNGSQTS